MTSHSYLGTESVCIKSGAKLLVVRTDVPFVGGDAEDQTLALSMLGKSTIELYSQVGETKLK